MAPTFHLIAAACENMGIGINGTLPWKLKNEMAYFTRMTSSVRAPGKRNAVLMGRRTWEGIPPKYRPLSGRLSVVIGRQLTLPEGVLGAPSLDEALALVQREPDVESVWVIGGAVLYMAAMEHPSCGYIYLTEIEASFPCDAFFPSLRGWRRLGPQRQQALSAPAPAEPQREGDVAYRFRVYEREPLGGGDKDGPC